MLINMVGAFIRNKPFGTEIAFAKGLRDIGVEINEYDPSVLSKVFPYRDDADATIVFKWLDDHDRGVLRLVPGPKIVYQPDDVAFPHIQEMMRKMREVCDYAFMYDDRGVKFAESLGYNKAQRLLLTADPDLYRPIDGVKKDIDVSFIGSLTAGGNHKSRVKMCQIVSGMAGLRSHFQGDVYDIGKIVEIYNRSKVVLNHATDVGQPFGQGFGYQCRHFEAGFTGACILSNEVTNRQPGDPQMMFTFDDEQNLVARLRFLVDRPDLCKQQGDDLYEELMENHRPTNRALEITEFIRGL